MSSKQAHNTSATTTEADAKAIEHLKQAVANGTHWYLALLEAIKLWSSAEEDYNERHYRYLIEGEAFDWLVLAERLCQEISELIPEKERIDLLFFDRPPLELTKDKFKKSIGPAKYRAYLNYLYGILVEEALISAVVDEVRKERRSLGINKHDDDLDKAYRRTYGASKQALLDDFRKAKRYPNRKSITLSEFKEFTYWLFKHRLETCDKSRVASDTKKALIQMHRNMSSAKRKA
ncbi:MAG: hypothetical protein H8D32_06790 [Dehalococcoidia bacterium]|nr:hypothetical protein [Dehalococcoidia bacterium]